MRPKIRFPKNILSVVLSWCFKKSLLKQYKDPLLIGMCSFYGNPQFIDLAKQGMSLLKEKDVEMYENIFKIKYTFYFNEKVSGYDCHNDVYGFSSVFIKLGANEIAAEIVYINYLKLYNDINATKKQLSWLLKAGFPAKNINAYEYILEKLVNKEKEERVG